MEDKTCGECQWYDYHHLLCVVGGDVSSADCACDSFIPVKLTNGDRVRQMSNKELAEIINNVDCKICPAYMTCFNGENKTCFDGMLAWLNAPADCVGKDNNVPAKVSEVNNG